MNLTQCVVCDPTRIMIYVPVVTVVVLIAFGIAVYLRYFMKVDEFGDPIK